MAERASAATEEPMVVDGGSAGLQQSRYHPNAGINALNAPATKERSKKGGTNDKQGLEKGLKRRIRSLAAAENKEEVDDLLERLCLAVEIRTANTSKKRSENESDETLVTLGQLKNVFKKAL